MTLKHIARSAINRTLSFIQCSGESPHDEPTLLNAVDQSIVAFVDRYEPNVSLTPNLTPGRSIVPISSSKNKPL
jgi:hypothetical protein